jgi:hypothetical protein
MNEVEVITGTSDWKRGLVNNSTCTTFPTVAPVSASKAATIDSATPTTNQVIISGSKNALALRVFGTGSNDQTINLRVYEIAAIRNASGGTSFVNTLLFSAVATLSTTLVGVASGVVGSSEYFADTIVVTDATQGEAIETMSPTGNTAPAEVRFDRVGRPDLLVVFDLGTASGANIAWREW